MKIYKTTNDYNLMPADICQHLLNVMDGEKGTFDALLGGDVYVLERVEELSEIVVDFTTGRTAVDTVGPMDACERLTDHTSFFMASNDAGGNVYFVPNWIVDSCAIPQAIVNATNAQWKEYRDANNTNLAILGQGTHNGPPGD